MTDQYEALRLVTGRPADRLLIVRRGLGAWIAWTGRRNVTQVFSGREGPGRSASAGVAGVLADILTDHPDIRTRLLEGALR